MKRIIAIVAAGLAFALMAAGETRAQVAAGYDALGRLKCVKYASGRYTEYTYDTAGNRQSVKTTQEPNRTCVSETGGAAVPAPPAGGAPTITTHDPDVPLASRAVWSGGVTLLGTASDGGALVITASATGGGVGSCGAVTHTASTLTYTAPMITPETATAACHVTFTLQHGAGVQKAGRVDFNITGEAASGGGGDPPPPGCEINPDTGLCEIE